MNGKSNDFCTKFNYCDFPPTESHFKQLCDLNLDCIKSANENRDIDYLHQFILPNFCQVSLANGYIDPFKHATPAYDYIYDQICQMTTLIPPPIQQLSQSTVENNSMPTSSQSMDLSQPILPFDEFKPILNVQTNRSESPKWISLD